MATAEPVVASGLVEDESTLRIIECEPIPVPMGSGLLTEELNRAPAPGQMRQFDLEASGNQAREPWGEVTTLNAPDDSWMGVTSGRGRRGRW